MADLVDLDQFKNHLRLSGTVEDDDLQMKLDLAEELVIDYVRQWVIDDGSPTWAATVDGWDQDTVPKRVQAAILLQAADFYRFRGDDSSETAPKRDVGMPSAGVVLVLHRLRDPALA